MARTQIRLYDESLFELVPMLLGEWVVELQPAATKNQILSLRIRIGNLPWHHSTHKWFLIKTQNILCDKLRIFSESCDHCSRELTEDGCTAFGKVFHKECFRCHGCKKRLDGKFFSKDDNAYCAKCFKVRKDCECSKMCAKNNFSPVMSRAVLCVQTEDIRGLCRQQ